MCVWLDVFEKYVLKQIFECQTVQYEKTYRPDSQGLS